MKGYSDFDEFVKEMRLLFKNWVTFRGKDHKMYKYCDAVEKRFEKYIEKQKLK